MSKKRARFADRLSGVSSFTTEEDFKSSFDSCQEEVAERFIPKKLQSELLADAFDDLRLRSRSDNVRRCGSFLQFQITPVSHKLIHASFCRDRLCPACNWRRSLKIFSQLSRVMDHLAADGYRFIFLTLTVKNCEPERLPETVAALLNGFYKLYRCKEFKKNVYGSFRALEITFNKKSFTFHPHLHCVLAVKESYFHHDSFITQRKWAELWQKSCSLDYMPIIDVRCLKSGKNNDKSAIKELSKYVAKGSDYLSGSFNEVVYKVSSLVDAISHRRLCAFTGVFKDAAVQLKLDDIHNGDLLNVNDNDEIRNDLKTMIVTYLWKTGFYSYEVR